MVTARHAPAHVFGITVRKVLQMMREAEESVERDRLRLALCPLILRWVRTTGESAHPSELRARLEVATFVCGIVSYDFSGTLHLSRARTTAEYTTMRVLAPLALGIESAWRRLGEIGPPENAPRLLTFETWDSSVAQAFRMVLNAAEPFASFVTRSAFREVSTQALALPYTAGNAETVGTPPNESSAHDEAASVTRDDWSAAYSLAQEARDILERDRVEGIRPPHHWRHWHEGHRISDDLDTRQYGTGDAESIGTVGGRWDWDLNEALPAKGNASPSDIVEGGQEVRTQMGSNACDTTMTVWGR
ncbi:hypothetical protein AURDEDRAFT_129930 [Auricularia subglabra TFB-10046 SS5]|uniref:Uncharacterized protein n=1 Tax=Auricularia subglabra (strain TFB-10046 / SS5) TaxID=717982 RepID=J0LGG9_AURST|nr:hypothetical protein AURDEDRAFT_129930 [Auricularia subglabra TFB-10046 SS5]